ncbi:hypothetical protein TSUD_371250 [Trifolium subterraneum]|uniref:RRM domain-containing protein n=1 Tax=Trifolium subterraneum TaxID=3900 RepID=A0A2Z6PV42_TRISU|nr:hypothetical protein TSUD_371250 [Trifolium subterraneum]
MAELSCKSSEVRRASASNLADSRPSSPGENVAEQTLCFRNRSYSTTKSSNRVPVLKSFAVKFDANYDSENQIYRARSRAGAARGTSGASSVVIPAKLDKRGRRFGFTRFNRITDARRLEHELDNIIIRRDKISVNLSRYQRREVVRRREGRCIGRRQEGDSRITDVRQGEEGNKHPNITNAQNLPREEEEGISYAQAVRNELKPRQERGNHSLVLSYEATKEDMAKLQKAFIEEAVQPGMTYNIQNAFHRQGYFRVKVTPLGSNLTLLEGQEDGEVQSLMEDASGWCGYVDKIAREAHFVMNLDGGRERSSHEKKKKEKEEKNEIGEHVARGSDKFASCRQDSPEVWEASDLSRQTLARRELARTVRCSFYILLFWC